MVNLVIISILLINFSVYQGSNPLKIIEMISVLKIH